MKRARGTLNQWPGLGRPMSLRPRACRRSAVGPGTCARRGLLLIEVVLAIAILVFAAGVVVGAFNQAVRQVERLQREADAADMAVSVLSELQMGLLPVAPAGPEPFEIGKLGWSWQVDVEPLDNLPIGSVIQQVIVTVTHDETGFRYRLTQFMPLEEVDLGNPVEGEQP
jgi:type II secretory pathway pseudopilin PulG